MPVDLNAFVEDEEVQDIIEKGAGIVNITQGSDTGLIAGNKKISGLESNKYYMVEEWDESGVSLGIQFVSANGERSENLVDIGPVSDGEISGLTNHYHYRVRSAAPLPGDVSYSVLTPQGGGLVQNTGGVITFIGPPDNSYVIYTLAVPSFSHIVEIPVTPAGSASPARLSQNGEIIALIGQGTVNDYVFFEDNDDATYFFVLRIISVEPGDLNITVSFSLNAAQKRFTLSPASVTISQADIYDLFDSGTVKAVSVTLRNAGIFDAGSIKWAYNTGQPDEIIWTGATLSINFADDDDANIALLVLGEYTISIEATVEGVAYSSSFVLVIEN